MDLDSSGDGTNVRRLTQDEEAENYPNWSPDGKQLVYQRDLNGSALYTIDADGTNQKRISPTPAFDVTPDWSPDGRQIIFSRLDGPITPGQRPQTEIHVINADGTGDCVVLPKSDFSVEPRWSVNNFVVFMSYRTGTQQIFTMKTDGSQLIQRTTEGSNGDPAWSPDGNKISFGSNREGNGKLNIFTMNSDGSEVKQISFFQPPMESGDTNWSRDGKQITFEYDISGRLQSDPDAFAEVWTVNMDGSQPRSTGQKCSGVGCAPRWRPK